MKFPDVDISHFMPYSNCSSSSSNQKKSFLNMNKIYVCGKRVIGNSFVSDSGCFGKKNYFFREEEEIDTLIEN
jgi:hypothetical protein